MYGGQSLGSIIPLIKDSHVNGWRIRAGLIPAQLAVEHEYFDQSLVFALSASTEYGYTP